jgi:tetraacyldisaccharide 4'-kinase
MSLLERIWWAPRGGPLERVAALLLALPALLFRAAVALRGALYALCVLPVARASVPVVSIGNLTVGGAGKTPVALVVAARLLARSRRVAILSRGYGATRRDPRVVSDGASVLLGAGEGGDEPVLLARRLPWVPVLCGPRRAELLPLAAALDADALLLDDGFQHRALARDLDVVVIDGANAVGNGRLLPAGPNREPVAALARAGLVWITRADQAPADRLEALRRIALSWTGRAAVESRHAPVDVLDGTLTRGHGLASLRGRRVFPLSGVARPAGFHRTLAELGAEVVEGRAYPDHHAFSGPELDEAFAAAEEARCELLVTTEKDAVRLPVDRAADPRLRVVRIQIELLAGADVLESVLDQALAAYPPPSTADVRAGTP